MTLKWLNFFILTVNKGITVVLFFNKNKTCIESTYLTISSIYSIKGSTPRIINFYFIEKIILHEMFN